MKRSATSWLEGALALTAVAWLTSALLPVLGLTSSALLFLLPVLLAATRGGLGPALATAIAGAAAYNFFLLEPRFTFQVHQLENLVSVFVLAAVAVVTSRLATRLMTREAEALERAAASEDAAALSAVLAAGPPADALAQGVRLLADRHGDLRLIAEAALPEGDAAFGALDLAAAAWAIHNGDRTGHGTEVMPAADWTFLPLAPRHTNNDTVAAVARPSDGRTRTATELEHLQQLCLLLGQARDRAALEAARREGDMLEERDRLRRTLLASLAHDFRTPLTVITGRLELLAGEHPQAREALHAARKLDHTMSDLLGMARIDAGSLAPAMENLDLVDAVGAASDTMTLPEGVSLVRGVPADLPFVTADPVLLHHVLANLLDNASRHAKATIIVSAREEADGVHLCVDDDGPGIPESERERMFDRFARLEGNDRTEGSGLGLAIVRGFAEAMGMAVSIATSPLGGARFEVAMPVTGTSS